VQRMKRTRAVGLAAVLSTAAMGLGACGKSEETTSSTGSGTSGNSADTQQQVKSQGKGQCTLQKYGAKKVDLANAVVGFSQSEKEANPFRIAETQSIKDEASSVGVKKLLTTNANSQLSKQISDIQDMLAQGAQVLIVAPLNSEGLEPAFNAAKKKGVPVITIDRKVSGKPCSTWVTFIGSDFVEQGKRAADAMIKATGGKANVAILLGSSGNNVTTDRTKGFVDEVKAQAPGIKVVARQTGDFARDKGQQVTEQLLQSNSNIDAIYAENDEMALGALVAIRSAGKQPGKDIKVVSVDGTRNAVQAIVDGKMNAVIESNPRFGPLAFKTASDFMSGKGIPDDVIISDRQYDAKNAKSSVNSAY
jgi:galactofuranose transport system substrate-binding protein